MTYPTPVPPTIVDLKTKGVTGVVVSCEGCGRITSSNGTGCDCPTTRHCPTLRGRSDLRAASAGPSRWASCRTGRDIGPRRRALINFSPMRPGYSPAHDQYQRRSRITSSDHPSNASHAVGRSRCERWPAAASSCVSAVVFSERFSSLFVDANINAKWPAAVVDREGKFIARNIDPDRMVGSFARPELAVAARGAEDRGTFANVTLKGVPVEGAFWRSSLTGWTSVVSTPTAELYAWYDRTLKWTVAFATAAVLLAWLCVNAVARVIVSETHKLGTAASALIESRELHRGGSTLREIGQVHEAFFYAEALAVEKRRDEERIKFLVKELSHRTKNLLAVVQGMSRFIVRKAPSIAEYSKEFEGRLQSLAISQDISFEQSSAPTALDDLLRQQLAPFRLDAVRIRSECTRFASILISCSRSAWPSTSLRRIPSSTDRCLQ
jgi:signal transduction histidine kinase